MCVSCAFCVRFLWVLCEFKSVTFFIKRQAVHGDKYTRSARFVAYSTWKKSISIIYVRDILKGCKKRPEEFRAGYGR
jgi:hypothetical protein